MSAIERQHRASEGVRYFAGRQSRSSASGQGVSPEGQGVEFPVGRRSEGEGDAVPQAMTQ